MSEKLVMFDLDGTLIDDTYATTDDRLNEAVRAATARGWDIGLSSDTPYEGLKMWRERFSMVGPIIAEKGAVVEVDNNVVFDQELARQMQLSRAAIANYLKEAPGTVTWEGDSTEAIRSKKCIGKSGERVVLINDVSICSLRFFVRTVDKMGQLQIDDMVTQATINELEPLLPDVTDASIDNNPDFGLFIITETKVNKRSGLQLLLARQSYERCVMVGNSMTDYVGVDIAEQFAVANANESYKKLSTVNEFPFTKGCIDILENLE